MSYVLPVVTSSGATFGSLQVGGFTGVLEMLVTANSAAQSNPQTAATVAVTAGGNFGGLLAAGTYTVQFTEIDGTGETTPNALISASVGLSVQAAPVTQSTASVGTATVGTLPAGGYLACYTYRDATAGETTKGSSESAAFTVAAGNTPTLTFHDAVPSFASGRNVYITAAGGTTGTETFYAFVTSAATLVISSAAVSPTVVPTVNTSTTNIPQVTFPALQTGNIARNLYVSNSSATSGTWTLYATGVTATTSNLSIVRPSNSYATLPPTINNTGLTYTDTNGNVHPEPLSMIRAFKTGNSQDVYRYLRTLVSDYLRGDPTNHSGTIMKLRHAHTAFQTICQACADIGTLIDANSGTIQLVSTPTGGTIPTRTFP